jgi:hypothetical protein
MLSSDPANHSCRKLFRQSNEGQAGRRLAPEGSFFTSQALNICSAPIVRPLAHSTEYGDTSAIANTSIHSKRGEGDRLSITVQSTHVFLTVNRTPTQAAGQTQWQLQRAGNSRDKLEREGNNI